jgi:S1-C subfamily serine protease
MFSNSFGRPRLLVTVLGLAALSGILVFSEFADAFHGSTGKVRAPRAGKLKKPAARNARPKFGDPFPNVTRVGLTCEETGANGAKIRAIKANSAADRTHPGSLDIGDVIVSVEDVPVQTVSDLDDLLGQAIKIGLPNVLLGVKDGQTGQVGSTLLDLDNLPPAARAARTRAKKAPPRR